MAGVTCSRSVVEFGQGYHVYSLRSGCSCWLVWCILQYKMLMKKENQLMILRIKIPSCSIECKG